MNSREVLQFFAEGADDLLQTFSRFTQEQINLIPFEGSWTAGQVGEHLLKGSSGLPQVLAGPTKETERPTDALVPTLTSIFLDFSTKLKSPDFIIPSNGPHDRDELLHSLSKAMEAIASTAAKVDLSKTCTSYALPQIGEMTGLEWVFFSSSHSRRHTHQLKNIYAELVAVKS
jgi:hypothetical protein